MSARLSPQLVLFLRNPSFMEDLSLWLIVKLLRMVRCFIFLNGSYIVTTKWMMHMSSKVTRQDPRDFKKLNKMSLRGGSVNARDQYKFRASHDARIPFGLVEDKPVMLPSEEFTYGKRNRPQTPVSTILANKFGSEAASDLQCRYKEEKGQVSETTYGKRYLKFSEANDDFEFAHGEDDSLPDGNARCHPRQVHRKTPGCQHRQLQT